MKLLRITLLVVMASLLTAGLIYRSDSGDNDWPRWRGSNMDGKALQTGVFKFDQGYGLKIGWKKQLGSGYSSISIADGRAVTMYSDSTFEYIVALDVDSGNELWKVKLDSTYKGHDGSHDRDQDPEAPAGLQHRAQHRLVDLPIAALLQQQAPLKLRAHFWLSSRSVLARLSRTQIRHSSPHL